MPTYKRERLFHAAGAILLVVVLALVGCRSTPTELDDVAGLFPLVRWNGLSLPVNLGFTPPGSCSRQVTKGSLTLDPRRQTFSYTVSIVNCNGLDEGTTQVDGVYAQSDSLLDFKILPQGPSGPYTHFYGQVLSDRIVVTDGATLEFKRN